VVASATAAPGAPPKPELPVEVDGFDKLTGGELATFIKLSDALDPLLGQQASLAVLVPRGCLTGAGRRSSKDLCGSTRVPPRIEKSQEAV
jgi:hypothetical protein